MRINCIVRIKRNHGITCNKYAHAFNLNVCIRLIKLAFKFFFKFALVAFYVCLTVLSLIMMFFVRSEFFVFAPTFLNMHRHLLYLQRSLFPTSYSILFLLRFHGNKAAPVSSWVFCDQTFKSAASIGFSQESDGSWFWLFNCIFCVLRDNGDVLLWRFTRGESFNVSDIFRLEPTLSVFWK